MLRGPSMCMLPKTTLPFVDVHISPVALLFPHMGLYIIFSKFDLPAKLLIDKTQNIYNIFVNAFWGMLMDESEGFCVHV